MPLEQLRKDFTILVRPVKKKIACQFFFDRDWPVKKNISRQFYFFDRDYQIRGLSKKNCLEIFPQTWFFLDLLEIFPHTLEIFPSLWKYFQVCWKYFQAFPESWKYFQVTDVQVGFPIPSRCNGVERDNPAQPHT